MGIKVIKLITGEDVMAEIEDVDNNKIKLTNPVRVSMVNTSSNQPTFGFIPFPLTSNDKEVLIDRSHIIFECSPAEEFDEQYRTLFGKVVTQSQKIIV